MTEEALLAAARRGDDHAFAALLDGYDRPLRALAYRVLGNRDDMDDAMQEAAVKAFTHLGSFDGRSSLGTWLHQVTYTTCLNLLRTRRGLPKPIDVVCAEKAREGEAGSTASGAYPDPALEVSERLDLGRALEALSADQRAALCLVLELGFSLEQAAEILEVPAGTVSSRLWHARALLRGRLESPSIMRGDHGNG